MRITNYFSKIRTVMALHALRFGFRVASVFAPATAVRYAARLFCKPLATSRARASAISGVGARETTLMIGGTPIKTYLWGEIPAQPYVLFSHGWSSHGTRVRPWIKALSEAGYAVVAFDQIGHGKSGGTSATLPGFTELLMEIGRRHGPAAAVIGHSLGGAAVAAALARGLSAGQVVLIAPAADPIDAAFRFSGLVGLPAYLCRRMIEQFERRIGISFAEFQAQYNAPQIARPVLIVHDLDDREVPWSEGERYARFWAGSRLLSTRGLGHNRIVQDESVISAALRFLHGDRIGERVVSSPNLPYGIA
jgi:pimeloyl-ACP methyl ester carboxylesterase